MARFLQALMFLFWRSHCHEGYPMKRDDGLVFDVGMHMGEDADFYLKKGYKVVAFEAHPDFVSKNAVRFSEAIKSGRLIIISGAVCFGTLAKVPFYVNETTVWGTINSKWAERNEQWGYANTQIEVPRIDLVDYFEKFGVPYYLKIDIEGSDLDAVRALQACDQRPRFLSIESNETSLCAALSEIDLLRALGFRRFMPVQQEAITGSHVALRSRDGTRFEHTFEDGASGVFGYDLPGEWLSYEQCRRRYGRIFLKARLIGDFSPVFGIGADGRRRFNVVRQRLEEVVGLTGWYDLHAAL
jgi:FkbM family methyltransferase